MFVLALETSTTQGSVALAEVDKNLCRFLFYKLWYRQKSHGEIVVSAIDEAFKMSQVHPEQLDACLISKGPGSFTGIRVGFSAIKPIAYNSNLPIYTANSLLLLASQVSKQKLPVLSMINAHKSQCYVASFKPTARGLTPILKPQAVSPEKLEKKIKSPHICVGDGYDIFKDQLSPRLKKCLIREPLLTDSPNAQTLIQLLAKSPKSLQKSNWKALEPLYIRGSEAEEKLKSGLLRPLPEY